MSGYPLPLVRQIWTPWNQTSAQAPPEIAKRENAGTLNTLRIQVCPKGFGPSILLWGGVWILGDDQPHIHLI